MKKLISFIFLLFFSFILFSCSEKKGVIIHKVFFTDTISENIVELKNTGKNTDDMSQYSIAIYSRGGRKKKTFSLSGTIKKEGFYIIGNTENKDIEDKLSIKIKDFDFFEKSVITLEKSGNIVDTFGNVGENLEFLTKTTYVRFPDSTTQKRKHDNLAYILFKNKHYAILKKDSPLTRDEVMRGPKFDKESLKKPFSYSNNINDTNGSGGSDEVDIKQIIDGDTTRFDSKRKSYDIDLKIRYAFIDTPESTPQGGYHPYGKSATKLTEILLNNADHIYLQSLEQGQTREGFGRPWGIVWADDKLIAFLMCKNGLSDANLGKDGSFGIGEYNNIPYANYCLMAKYLAVKEKLGIHSGKNDPFYDYKTKQFIEPCGYTPNYLD